LFKYRNDALSNKKCTNLHTFPEQKSVHWTKHAGSKILFDFVDILD